VSRTIKLGFLGEIISYIFKFDKNMPRLSSIIPWTCSTILKIVEYNDIQKMKRR